MQYVVNIFGLSTVFAGLGEVANIALLFGLLVCSKSRGLWLFLVLRGLEMVETVRCTVMQSKPTAYMKRKGKVLRFWVWALSSGVTCPGALMLM